MRLTLAHNTQKKQFKRVNRNLRAFLAELTMKLEEIRTFRVDERLATEVSDHEPEVHDADPQQDEDDGEDRPKRASHRCKNKNIIRYR